MSNLAYLGKIIEKVAVSQMEAHMTEPELHETFQSAYRAHHSTETALIRVANDALRAADQRKCVLLTLLDFSAFDTIDHKRFLDRLQGGFVISYFQDRYQSVYIDPTAFAPVHLPTGFPKGSVIGPFGFKPYTKPLSAIAQKHGVSIHLYADDTQLYVSCDPTDIEAAMAQMEGCIKEIRMWMAQNNLKLNDTKTEYLI